MWQRLADWVEIAATSAAMTNHVVTVFFFARPLDLSASGKPDRTASAPRLFFCRATRNTCAEAGYSRTGLGHKSMMRFVVPCAAFAATFFVSLPAHAQLTRTFVSSSGVDTNPCTVAAPCATFARAYSLVASNGIVAALDPGKYGPLTITGPVTIDGNGWAAITAPSSGIGIEITAGPSDNVILRGITIDGGSGTPNAGIQFNSGASLTITGCVVRDFIAGGAGLVFSNSATPAQTQTLTVADSQFVNSAGSGVVVDAQSAGATTASFVRTEFTGNAIGLELASAPGAINAAVTDSVVANNSNDGFYLDSGGSSPPWSINLSLTSDQIAGSQYGINVMTIGSGMATVWLAASTVTGNTNGAFVFNGSNGVINSYGNNYFVNNGDNNSTTGLTTVGTQ
jgi:hypothetical protein